MNDTAPTPQEITAQLRILNRAQLNYRHAAGRDEKNQADETFQTCWDWFKLHGIVLKQDAESGFWASIRSSRGGNSMRKRFSVMVVWCYCGLIYESAGRGQCVRCGEKERRARRWTS